jgi:dihydropteroate synthase
MQINCKGKLIDLSHPKVMGIVNITPDSFYSGSRCEHESDIIEKVALHISEGATFIDIGAYSTRPGCAEVSEEEELRRIELAMRVINREFPDALVSVDTYRSKVAEIAVKEYGAAIINDISGGVLDSNMFATVAQCKVPYILMHMVGTPQTMQQHCYYSNMMLEIVQYFARQTEQLNKLGVNDIILDAGFGFSKNLDQNYELLHNMDMLKVLNAPILVGVSRKSMVYKLLNTTPEESVNGTSVVNTLALCKGANILRVHDTKQAMEVVKICEKAGFIS